MIHWKPRLAVLLLLVTAVSAAEGGIFWEMSRALSLQ